MSNLMGLFLLLLFKLAQLVGDWFTFNSHSKFMELIYPIEAANTVIQDGLFEKIVGAD